MDNLKFIFNDNQILFEVQINEISDFYTEKFSKENLENMILNYINLVPNQKVIILKKSFVKSIKNMSKFSHKVMTVYKNGKWVKFTDINSFNQINKSCQNKSDNKIETNTTNTLILKDLLKKKSEENNPIIKELELSILKNPNDDYSYFKLGSALIDLGRFDDAIDNLREAISLDETKPDYYYALGVAYHKLSKSGLAVSELIIAINLDPENYYYIKLLAEIYFDWGKYTESIETYYAAMESGIPVDQMFEVQLGLARIYNKLEYYDDAIHLFQDVLYLDPEHEEAKRGLEESLLIKKRLTSADMNNLGIAYAEKNKMEKAIEKFKKAIEINPQDPEFYFNLAMAYKKNNMLNESVIEFKNTLKVDPKFFDAYAELGEIYQNQNNIYQAAKDYQTFIENSKDIEKVQEIKKIISKF